MARPPFSKYGLIGQREVITFLDEIFARSLADGETVPAFLLIGPQGCGKTSLARGLAGHYQGKFKTILAGKDVTPLFLCGYLDEIQYGDTLFIDEVHGLSPASQEVLYPVIDFQRRPTIQDGKLDRANLASVAAFNLLCATTEPGRLLAHFAPHPDSRSRD